MRLTIFFGMAGILVLTACGQGGTSQSSATPQFHESEIVVKSTATLNLSTGDQSRVVSRTVDGSVPVSVSNSPSSSMTIGTSNFGATSITNTIVNFGYVNMVSIFDNNLDVCGTNGATHCGNAIIRVYTTGTPIPGLYNSVDNYGVPLTSGRLNCSYSSVGLDVAGATIVQTVPIAATQHVLTLSDFYDANYGLQADFTNAGAGSYSTTLVIEYALTP